MTAPDHGSPLLRKATPADVERIGEIAVAAWQRVFTHWRTLLGDDIFEIRNSGWEERWQRMGEAVNRTGNVLVTEIGGQVVGFATYEPDPESGGGEIRGNAVDPAFQRRGIGTRQCAAVIDVFRRAGMKYAKVFTGLDASHAPARSQYLKAGFDRSVAFHRCYGRLSELNIAAPPGPGASAELRAARLSDAEVLRSLTAEAWTPVQQRRRQAVGECVFQGEFAGDPEKLCQELTEVLKQDAQRVLVAEKRGRPVGACLWLAAPDTRTGRLQQLAVRPKCQGHGIGTRLALAALARFRDEGMAYVEATLPAGTVATAAEHVLTRLGLTRVLPFIQYYMDL